ncbi:hypothetical protein LJK87_08965 [Paenibacillus sp. P25]|nr:hypothetical protein LJK87_08965 [Paenibacillus sp. P25]
MEGSLSGAVDAAEGGFRFIDSRTEPAEERLTALYPLANHEVFKRQILEEMKYRAPMIYSLEIADKFKKNGLAASLGQASRFTENAARIEKLLEERDDRLDEAWEAFLVIRQKALDLHPFYQTQLRDLNELSGRIGIHTVEEVRGTLSNAKSQVQALSDQIRGLTARLHLWPGPARPLRNRSGS